MSHSTKTGYYETVIHLINQTEVLLYTSLYTSIIKFSTCGAMPFGTIYFPSEEIGGTFSSSSSSESILNSNAAKMSPACFPRRITFSHCSCGCGLSEVNRTKGLP